MNRNLFNFNLLLGFSALFIAGCAAFFSIWGIGLLFSGASIAAMVMASSLELGKLVATSFLYRFWTKSQWLLKSYLCGSVFILMLITSLGIFGYLTSAYQQSSIKYTMMLDSIKLLEDQKKQEQSKISEVKSRIDSLSALRKTQESRLSEINTNPLLARNPIQFRQVQDQTMELIDQTDKNIKVENDKSSVYSTVIDSIDKKIADANTKIATLQRVADEAQVKADSAITAQVSTRAAAEAATQIAVVQANEAAAVKLESITKTAAATKAAADASLAAKVATAAKVAADKVPAKAVIAAKPNTSTGKNSTKATISGLKPGQKVKVTVNVKGK